MKQKGRGGDLTGKVHWRLTVISRVLPVESDTWLVKCICGTELELGRLKFLGSRSCGCHRGKTKLLVWGQESTALKNALTKEQEDAYQIWYGMHTRCCEKKDFLFPDYGGRGIRVCKEWSNFYQFYIDMGARPSKDHSIEREDVNKGYSPPNCSWILKSDQGRNTRRTIRIIYRGIQIPLRDFLEHHPKFTREDFGFVDVERKKNGRKAVEATEAIFKLCEYKGISQPL